MITEKEEKKIEKASSTYSKPRSFVWEYNSLVLKFQNLLLQHSVNVKAFSSQGLKRFQNLEVQEQEKYTSQLRNYYNICNTASEAGIDIANNTKEMVEFTSNQLKLTAPSDFLKTVTTNDIVEVFDYEGTQLYRNMKFFEISDYTIDDFFGARWDQLYDRAESVTQKLIERVEYATSIKKCIPFDIDEHYMRESATKNQKIVKVHLKYIAPLLRNNTPVAWIASSEAEVVQTESKKSESKISFLRSNYDV